MIRVRLVDDEKMQLSSQGFGSTSLALGSAIFGPSPLSKGRRAETLRSSNRSLRRGARAGVYFYNLSGRLLPQPLYDNASDPAYCCSCNVYLEISRRAITQGLLQAPLIFYDAARILAGRENRENALTSKIPYDLDRGQLRS